MDPLQLPANLPIIWPRRIDTVYIPPSGERRHVLPVALAVERPVIGVPQDQQPTEGSTRRERSKLAAVVAALPLIGDALRSAHYALLEHPNGDTRDELEVAHAKVALAFLDLLP